MNDRDIYIALDLSKWTRLEEVDRYAEKRKISRGTAILELVNSGLSHFAWDCERALKP